MQDVAEASGMHSASRFQIQNIVPYHSIQSISCRKCNVLALQYMTNITGSPPWLLKLGCGRCHAHWHVCTMCHGKLARNLQISESDIVSHSSVHAKREYDRQCRKRILSKSKHIGNSSKHSNASTDLNRDDEFDNSQPVETDLNSNSQKPSVINTQANCHFS